MYCVIINLWFCNVEPSDMMINVGGVCYGANCVVNTLKSMLNIDAQPRARTAFSILLQDTPAKPVSACGLTHLHLFMRWVHAASSAFGIILMFTYYFSSHIHKETILIQSQICFRSVRKKFEENFKVKLLYH